MLVTQQLLVPLDIHSMKNITMEVNWPANILPNIFFCVKPNNGIDKGLEQLKGE